MDSILCVSVNDTFVMNAWKAEQRAENITFIPDGNGEFTRGMEMLVEKADVGFGPCSWRYSMLVRDGVIEKMFVEPNKLGDPFEVSDADTLLRYLALEFKVLESVSLFTKPGCPFCTKAKQMLIDNNMQFEEIVLVRTQPPSACAPYRAASRCHRCSSAVVILAAATIWNSTCCQRKKNHCVSRSAGPLMMSL